MIWQLQLFGCCGLHPACQYVFISFATQCDISLQGIQLTNGFVRPRDLADETARRLLRQSEQFVLNFSLYITILLCIGKYTAHLCIVGRTSIMHAALGCERHHQASCATLCNVNLVRPRRAVLCMCATQTTISIAQICIHTRSTRKLCTCSV